MESQGKTLQQLADEARTRVPEINCEEFSNMEDEALVIDVREPEELEKGAIPNSVLIPRGVLERDIADTCFDGELTPEAKATRIICYCGGGTRSVLAADSLYKLGFTNVYSLAGGISAWKKENS